MAQTKPKAGQFFGIIGHGTDGYFLMTNGDGTMSWAEGGASGPSVTSVDYPGDDTAADPAGGQTVVLTGTGFATSGMSVTIGGTTAPSVSHTSNTQLTITTPAKAAGDYDIVVTNGVTGTSGTFVNGISYNGIPTWTTAAGSLGTFESETTISTITLQATEPDGGTITFNITSGALPSGLSLTGANIDGTTTAESSTTLYSFTIEAIDDENQATPRNFSITVNSAELVSSENFTINTYTGTGSTQSIEGKIGTAADFNGSSSRVSLPSSINTSYVTPTGSFSASTWVNFNTIGSAEQQIICFNTTANLELSLNTNSNIGKVVMRIYKSGASPENVYLISTTTLSANTWYHIAITHNNGSWALYVNGTSEDTGTQTLTQPTTNIYLGERLNNSQYLDGKIDQVRFFNKALSSSEVTTLYGESNTSSTKSTTDIFDDGSGVALYEFEKGAIDTGGGSGYIGGGGIFNGSSSYITTSQVINANSAFSISMWINPIDVSGCMLYTNNATNGFAFGYDIDNTSQGLGVWKAGVGTLFTSGDDVTAKTWQHIVLTYDGSGNWEIYKDNTSIHTQSSTSHTFTSSTNSYIGRDTSTSFNYNGSIDQVRIFNKALSSSEVTTLYGETSASATKSTTDIFDDGSGIALYELEGNANTTPYYPYGTGDIDSGQSASLNGSSSKIDFTGSLTGITNNFSYSFWANSTTSSTNFIGIASNISSGTNRILFNFNESGNYFFDFGNISSGGRISGTTPASWFDGNWHHFVVVKTPTSQLIYVDGAEFRNVTGQNSSVSGLTDFTIGNYTSNYTSGKIDQVRVYSTALGPSDVEALVSETNVPTSNLVAHYKLDGNANDETTNYNGTWGGTEAYSDPAEYPFIQYNGTATNVTYAYDGTPTNVSFVGTAFQPDFVWIKDRDTAEQHGLFDSVRGADLWLHSETTQAESNYGGGYGVTSFDSNGFTIGTGTAINRNNDDYVAWCWKAADTTTTIAANTVGNTIASDVRANQDAGFSIVKYQANATQGATIGHGLSSAPEMIITKEITGPRVWCVYHKDLTDSGYYLELNTSDAEKDSLDTAYAAVPGSTTYSVGSSSVTNSPATDSYIAYCFHSVDGYQKVGSYTGTGGAISVDVGFRPRFVMIKRATGGTAEWVILDSQRGGGAASLSRIYPNFSNAEDALQGEVFYDDGFKPRQTATAATNINGSVYIYLAIA
jgi:hypothetical protein